MCSIACLVTITVDTSSVTLLARSSEDTPEQESVKILLVSEVEAPDLRFH